MIFANGTIPTAATGGQYPDVRSDLQRLEAWAKYTFDEAWVRQMGWSGKVIAKVRYAWERTGSITGRTTSCRSTCTPPPRS